MARKLERAQVSLLRKVVSEDWELWNFAPGRPTLTAKRFARAEDVPIRVTVALPLQQTLCLAQWVPTTDLEVARDVLQLNLEQRGLLASSSPSDLSVRMIEKSDSEALFRAALLRPDFPSELTFVHAERFEPLLERATPRPRIGQARRDLHRLPTSRADHDGNHGIWMRLAVRLLYTVMQPTVHRRRLRPHSTQDLDGLGQLRNAHA